MASREAVVRLQITPEAQQQIRDALAQFRLITQDFLSTISGQLRLMRVPSELTDTKDRGGHMQYGDPDLDWTEWVAANDDRDEATQLLALREYIAETARAQVGQYQGPSASWLNKKLAKLGITERIAEANTYTIDMPVTAKVRQTITAATRADAERQFGDWLDGVRARVSVEVTSRIGPATFVTGPEDTDSTPDPDAPTTVAGTLDMLREIIWLGHIAGPKYCESSANKVLSSFGLPHIPTVKRFTVRRAAEVLLETEVSAYDEESAARVGGWRWEDSRSGFQVVDVDRAGILEVDSAS